MLGLTIFAGTLLGLAMLMVSTVHTSDGARRVSAAVSLAQSKIEDLQAAGYAAAASSALPESLTETGATAGALFYTRSWTVTVNTPVANAKTVLVTVAWSDTLGDHNVQLRTIII